MPKQFYRFSFFLLCCFLAACSRGGPMATMSQEELLQRYHHCVTAKPTTPAYVTACGNIERECEMRETEQGKEVCVVAVPKESEVTPKQP
ncbi:MAG: hypothetical protein K6L73_09660 [Cellvibrionaceae bacterium]